MKKIILLAVVAASVTIVSCRKERTCSCTWTNTTTPTTGASTTSTGTYKVTMDKQKSKDFRLTQGCYDTKSTQTFTNYTTVQENKCVVE